MRIRGASFRIGDYFTTGNRISSYIAQLYDLDRIIEAEAAHSLSSFPNEYLLGRGSEEVHRPQLSLTTELERLATGGHTLPIGEPLASLFHAAATHSESIRIAFERRAELVNAFEDHVSFIRREEQAATLRLLQKYCNRINSELSVVPRSSPHQSRAELVARMVKGLSAERVKPSRFYSALRMALRVSANVVPSPTAGWSGWTEVSDLQVVCPSPVEVVRSRRVREPNGPYLKNSPNELVEEPARHDDQPQLTPWPSERVVRTELTREGAVGLPSLGGSQRNSSKESFVWRELASPRVLSPEFLPGESVYSALRSQLRSFVALDHMAQYRGLMLFAFRELYGRGGRNVPFLRFLEDLQKWTTSDLQRRSTPLASLLRSAIRDPAALPLSTLEHLSGQHGIQARDHNLESSYQAHLSPSAEGDAWFLTGISGRHPETLARKALQYSIAADFGLPPNARRDPTELRIIYPFTEEAASPSQSGDRRLDDLTIYDDSKRLALRDHEGQRLLIRETMPIDFRVLPLGARLLDGLFSPAAGCQLEDLGSIDPVHRTPHPSGLCAIALRREQKVGSLVLSRRAWSVTYESHTPKRSFQGKSFIEAVDAWVSLDLPESFYFRPTEPSVEGALADSRKMFASLQIASSFEMFWVALSKSKNLWVEEAGPDPAKLRQAPSEVIVSI